MFGLSNLFSAIKRLTVSINQTADLWDAANEQLRQRLAVDPAVGAEVPALEHQPELLETRSNGRKAKR
jgi:hypothetical protein